MVNWKIVSLKVKFSFIAVAILIKQTAQKFLWTKARVKLHFTASQQNEGQELLQREILIGVQATKMLCIVYYSLLQK